MLLLFIKNYLFLFITIGIIVILLLIIGMFFILKSFKKPQQISSHLTNNIKSSNNKPQITASDIRAIAGEDELTTQLDLARAYIEVGKKQLAQKMLNYIVQQGTNHQQQQARELMGLLNEKV